MQKPTLGRIVHYTDSDNQVSPAMVVQVHSEDNVNLAVFPDNEEGIIRYTSVPLDEAGEQAHSWRWPPRVE